MIKIVLIMTLAFSTVVFAKDKRKPNANTRSSANVVEAHGECGNAVARVQGMRNQDGSLNVTEDKFLDDSKSAVDTCGEENKFLIPMIRLGKTNCEKMSDQMSKQWHGVCLLKLSELAYHITGS